MNEPLRGRGLIQMWKFVGGKVGKEGFDLSGAGAGLSLCYAMTHDAATVWQMKWCNDPALMDPLPSSKHLSRMGLLAAAMGDGRVCIFSPPFDDDPSLKSGRRPGGVGGAVRLRPVAESSSLCDRNSMPSSVAWHPAKPCNMLLVRMMTRLLSK